MSEHYSKNKELVQTQDTKPEAQNPAMLVKTPKLPVKVEFAQDQSEQQKPQDKE